MKKYLFLALFVTWSTQVFSATATSLALLPTDLVVNGLTNTTFELNSKKPSGDATAESAPARVYVPMTGPGTPENYFTIKGVTQLFDTVTTGYQIGFPLYVNTTASNYYLYAAVKSSTGTWTIAAISSTTFNNSTNLSYTFAVSPAELCAQVPSDCLSVTTSSMTKALTVHFFLSTDLPASKPVGSSHTPATGIYFEVSMSNKIPTPAPTIVEIRPGDQRIIIKYDTTAMINNAKALRFYNHGGTASAVAPLQPIQSYFASGGDLMATEHTYAISGEITVTGLLNGTTNYISILAVDLWKFGTVLSDDKEGSPKAIEELLKKEGCFLLTAGFGQEHFVIDYFRHFRDTVLAKTFLGRKFISVYYEMAPKYALMIYQHETIRAGIRGVAYTLYFIFNYIGFIIVFSLVGALTIYLCKKREKIEI